MCATLPIRSRSAIANDEIESVVRGRRNSGPRSSLRGFRAADCLDVRFWHKADMPSCTAYVRFWGKSGHDVLHCTCLLLTHSGHVQWSELGKITFSLRTPQIVSMEIQMAPRDPVEAMIIERDVPITMDDD